MALCAASVVIFVGRAFMRERRPGCFWKSTAMLSTDLQDVHRRRRMSPRCYFFDLRSMKDRFGTWTNCVDSTGSILIVTPASVNAYTCR